MDSIYAADKSNMCAAWQQLLVRAALQSSAVCCYLVKTSTAYAACTWLSHCRELALLGLRVKQITADGNCFFRALSDQLEVRRGGGLWVLLQQLKALG
jgi:hypothetical protein